MPRDTFPIQNSILKRLPESDLRRLGQLERVNLALRQPLEAANAPNEYVYFIEDAVASVVWDSSNRNATEICLIGFKGMTGIGIVYGDTQTPFETFMQLEGAACRCETAKLAKLWQDSSVLRTAVALCEGILNPGQRDRCDQRPLQTNERLARWLLMISDRTGATFRITHEFISVMLAVTRPGVTLALQTLEGRRLIRASRGAIEIVDRTGVEALARGAYGLPERESRRLAGAP
jgi:hypothetical protein